MFVVPRPRMLVERVQFALVEQLVVGRLMTAEVEPEQLLLTVPRVRTELARRAFSVVAPQTWNSLPADIRSCHTLQTFKRKLKTHL